MSLLTTKDKIAIGLLATITITDLIFVILLASNLNYKVTASKATTPTFTVVPNSQYPCDLSTAATNPIAINFTNAGTGLYTLAIVALSLCVGTIGIYGSVRIGKKTQADKAGLGLISLSAACNIILIILLAVPLTYNLSSIIGTTPKFIIDSSAPQKAAADNILFNYAKGGAGLYTLAILGFIASFTAMELIVEVRSQAAKLYNELQKESASH